MNVIVITGASDGIGAEVALVLAARTEEKLAQVGAQCAAAHAQVLEHRCDVSVESECRALVNAAVARFGRIDTLVNNAGMSAHARFEDVQNLDWYRRLMDINLWGSVWCTQAALPHLKRSQGRIVAVASLAGLIGVPGRTAYSATKFAMTGFFEALRTEVAPQGVSVTIAYPGVVATEIRYRGFNERGEPAGRSGLDERGAMSVQTCASLILQAMERRQRDVVMTAKGKLGRWMKLLMPQRVDEMAMKALRREERVR
jgi:short-subunit dehydrogenase